MRNYCANRKFNIGLLILAFLIPNALFLIPYFSYAQEPQKGKASYYSKRATGTRTSSGERLHHDSLTCAHRTHPFGTMLKVTNIQNGRTVVVRVTDRGPFGRGRIIDLSYRAARELGILSQGVAMVTVELANELIIPFKPKEDKVVYEIDFETPAPEPSITPIWQELKEAHKKPSKPLNKLGDKRQHATGHVTQQTTQSLAQKQKTASLDNGTKGAEKASTNVFDEIDKNPNKSRVSQKRTAVR